MKGFRTLFVLFIYSWLSVAVCFAERSEAEALRIARAECTRIEGEHGQGAPRMRADEARIASATSGYYAVNMGEGFVIVAKDERMPAVLGYSDHGLYEQDSLPAGLRYWLRGYEHAAVSNGGTLYGFQDVCAPLVPSHWDQDAPFNNQCPQYSASDRCVTGCAATAVAQIMFAHRHPTRGTGTESYRWRCEEDNSYSGTLSVDFSAATYDWAHMLNRYSGLYTATQANAVAQLMYHLGVGMHMDYSSSGSGAIDYYMVNVLYEHMGYSRDIRTIVKDYWHLADLQQALHDELAAGRPILTTGYDETGGHAFVCDGYNTDGLFHFNWGWSGYGDGYYRVTELNPTVQGIGANSLGSYNMGTTFYTGIRPETGTSEGRPQLFADSVVASPSSVARNGEMTVQLPMVYNGSVFGLYNQYSIGIALLSTDDESVVSILDQFTESDHFYVGSYYSEPLSFSCRVPSSVSNGSYRLCGVFKAQNGEWQKIECLGGEWYKEVKVTGSRVTVSAVDHSLDYPAATLQAEGISLSYAGINRTDTFSMLIAGLRDAGQTDFTGMFGIGLYASGSDELLRVLSESSMIHSIGSGESFGQTLRISSKAIASDVAAGAYELRPVSQVLYQAWQPIVSATTGQPLRLPIRVTRKSVWLQEIELQEGVSFGRDTVVVTESMPTLHFTIPASVHNFTCDVALHIETWDKQILDEQVVSDVSIGGVYEYTFPATLPDATKVPRNRDYRAVLRWRMDSSDTWRTYSPYAFSVWPFFLLDPSEPMGVEGVEGKGFAPDRPYTIYSLTGQRLSMLPEHGCYVVLQDGRAYKIAR